MRTSNTEYSIFSLLFSELKLAVLTSVAIFSLLFLGEMLLPARYISEVDVVFARVKGGGVEPNFEVGVVENPHFVKERIESSAFPSFVKEELCSSSTLGSAHSATEVLQLEAQVLSADQGLRLKLQSSSREYSSECLMLIANYLVSNQNSAMVTRLQLLNEEAEKIKSYESLLDSALSNARSNNSIENIKLVPSIISQITLLRKSVLDVELLRSPVNLVLASVDERLIVGPNKVSKSKLLMVAISLVLGFSFSWSLAVYKVVQDREFS